jgi:hypothetical protein
MPNDYETRPMSHLIYGDDAPDRRIGLSSRWDIAWGKHAIATTRWGRLKLKAWMFPGRVRDAWLVLTGRAEIGDEW